MDKALRDAWLDLEKPSRALEAAYSARFTTTMSKALKSMANPVPSELAITVEQLRADDAARYAKREFSPRVYAALLFITRSLELILEKSPIDPAPFARISFYVLEAGLTEEQERDWVAV